MSERSTHRDGKENSASSIPGAPRLFALTTNGPIPVKARAYKIAKLGLDVRTQDTRLYSSVNFDAEHQGLWRWLGSLAIPQRCYEVELSGVVGQLEGRSWELSAALAIVTYVAKQQATLSDDCLKGRNLLVSGCLDLPQEHSAKVCPVQDWSSKLASAHQQNLLETGVVICPNEDAEIVSEELTKILGTGHQTVLLPVKTTSAAIERMVREWCKSDKRWLKSARSIEPPPDSELGSQLQKWWPGLTLGGQQRDPQKRRLHAVERALPRPTLRDWAMSRLRFLDRIPENLCNLSLRPLYGQHRFDETFAFVSADGGTTAPAAKTLQAWVNGEPIPTWMPRDEGVLALQAGTGFGKSTLLDLLEREALQRIKWNDYAPSPGEPRHVLPLRINAGLAFKDLPALVGQPSDLSAFKDELLRLALSPLLLPGENPRAAWHALLDEFSLVVLLDELDELPGEALRNCVLDTFIQELQTNGRRELPRRILHLHRLVVATRPESVRMPREARLIGIDPLDSAAMRTYAEGYDTGVFRTIQAKQEEWGSEIRALLTIPLYLHIICQAVRDKALIDQPLKRVDQLLGIVVEDALQQALPDDTQDKKPLIEECILALEAIARASIDATKTPMISFVVRETLVHSHLINQTPDGVHFAHRIFWEWAMRSWLASVASPHGVDEIVPIVYDPRVLDLIRRWPQAAGIPTDRAGSLRALFEGAWQNARKDSSVDSSVSLGLLEAATMMAAVERPAPKHRSRIARWMRRAARPLDAEVQAWQEQVKRYTSLFDECTNAERVQICEWAFRLPCEESWRLAIKAWLGPRSSRRLRDAATAALIGPLRTKRLTSAAWQRLLQETGCASAVGVADGPLYQANQTMRTAELGRQRRLGRRVAKYLIKYLPTRRQRVAAIAVRHPLIWSSLGAFCIICIFTFLVTHRQEITYGGATCWFEPMGGWTPERKQEIVAGVGVLFWLYPIGLLLALGLERFYLGIFAKTVRVGRRLFEGTRSAWLWLMSSLFHSEKTLARWQDWIRRQWQVIGDPTRDLERRLHQLLCAWRCTYRLKLSDDDRQRLFSPFLIALRERRKHIEAHSAGTECPKLSAWQKNYGRLIELAQESDIDVERQLEKLLTTSGIAPSGRSSSLEIPVFPVVRDPLSSYKRVALLFLIMAALMSDVLYTLLSGNGADPWFFLKSDLNVVTIALCGLFLLACIGLSIFARREHERRLRTLLVMAVVEALLALPLLIVLRSTNAIDPSQLMGALLVLSVLLGAPYVVAMTYLVFASDRTRVFTSEWLFINSRWLRIELALLITPAMLAASWPYVRFEETESRIVYQLYKASLAEKNSSDGSDSPDGGKLLVEEIEELAASVGRSKETTTLELAKVLKATIGRQNLSVQWKPLWDLVLANGEAADGLRRRLAVALSSLVTYPSMRPLNEDFDGGHSRQIWDSVISFIDGGKPVGNDPKSQEQFARRTRLDEVRTAVQQALIEETSEETTASQSTLQAVRKEELERRQNEVSQRLNEVLASKGELCVNNYPSQICDALQAQLEELRWANGLNPSIMEAVAKLTKQLGAAAQRLHGVKGKDKQVLGDRASFYSAILACAVDKSRPEIGPLTERLLMSPDADWVQLARLIALIQECDNEEDETRGKRVNDIVTHLEKKFESLRPSLWSELNALKEGEALTWAGTDPWRIYMVEFWSAVLANAAESALAARQYKTAVDWSTRAVHLQVKDQVSIHILHAMALSFYHRESGLSAVDSSEIQQHLQKAAAGYCRLHQSERSTWHFDGTLRALKRMAFPLEFHELSDIAALINKPKRPGQSEQLIQKLKRFEEILLRKNVSPAN